MTDYKRGKGLVTEWAIHWNDVADAASRNVTIEAKLVEYGQPIRTAFTGSQMPEQIMTAMKPRIRTVHGAIMGLPRPEREKVIVWTFGDKAEIIDFFGMSKREPADMVGIYRKLGRRCRR